MLNAQRRLTKYLKLQMHDTGNDILVTTYIHTYMHTYIHTHIHTYIHTYIHI